MKKTFRKFRKLAKFLRTPIQITILKIKKQPLPKMDTVVRWNSSFDLIYSMVKLKHHCVTADFKKQSTTAKIPNLTAADWKFAERFLLVFKPPKICTKKLQGEQVTGTLQKSNEARRSTFIRQQTTASCAIFGSKIPSNFCQNATELFQRVGGTATPFPVVQAYEGG